jgi:hydroxymethylglutaryl-CoA lyase
MRDAVKLVEVGPRDGFQPIVPFIPTERKIELVTGLHRAGVRHMEAAAFASPRAVPQMADAEQVMAAAQALPGLNVQVLAPNAKHALRAVEAGARSLVFVLSVSEKHNFSNVRCTPEESIEDYRRLVAELPADLPVRLNLATAFDCPFDGAFDLETTLRTLEPLVAIKPGAEIALCDTTGRVTPDRVRDLFQRAGARFGEVGGWAFHGHDTYGVGMANVMAAFDAGVRVFDASMGGLGGCPFAPGATGNVATEDVVWAFERMGVETGIDLAALVDVAAEAVALPGACAGGRVRNALLAAGAAA